MTVNTKPGPTRREILVGVAATGAALSVGCTLSGEAAAAEAGAVFDLWLRIAADDTVTILVPQAEMGQGIYTSLPMLLAEELGCAWEKVTVEAAPVAAAYRNVYLVKEMLSQGRADELTGAAEWTLAKLGGIMGQQVTGGSTSVRGLFRTLRLAGATAREMLIAAAAARLAVDPATCVAAEGKITHAASSRSLRYGEIAVEAAKIRPPEVVALKLPSQWTLIGKPTRRLDSGLKTDGRATFGADVRLEGMLYGAIRHPPRFGAKLARYDSNEAARIPGLRGVIPVGQSLVVVAESTWQARKAADKIGAAWTEDRDGAFDSAKFMEDLARQAATEDGRVAEKAGEIGPALIAGRRIDAEYRVPFLAHATMEPMVATARVSADLVEVWAPTQAQEMARDAAAKAANVGKDKVRIYATYLGGGFGRRAEADYIAPAVIAAKATGRPVQIAWSREEDMRNDFYRPAAVARLSAALGANGLPTAFSAHVASASILKRIFPPVVWLGPDETMIEGLARLAYDIPNRRVMGSIVECPVPVGFWRSVGHSYSAFMKESFVDELALAAGQDPLAYRRALLVAAPRHRAVLDLAAEKAGYGRDLGPRRAIGLALHNSFGSIVAEAAEVAVEADGAVVPKRIVCAVDCGTVVNPLTVEAQMESGIVFGLSAAMTGAVTIKGGGTVEGNFDDYPVSRLADVPPIEVHIVKSDATPGGVGEPSTPPIAPALANAIARATGKRLRHLPLAPQAAMLKI